MKDSKNSAYFQYDSVQPHFWHNIHLIKSSKSWEDAMIIYLFCVHQKKMNQNNLKTCINVKKSVHLVLWVDLFLLCVPKKAIFKWGSFRTAPLEWSICTRQQNRQKSNHVRVISPLQSHLTYRHPQFSLKGSRRALSQKTNPKNKTTTKK